MRPAMQKGEATIIMLAVLASSAISLSAIGAIWYGIGQHPALLPILPMLAVGVAIGAMDRTDGDVRRKWAWVAVNAGLLAILAIIVAT